MSSPQKELFRENTAKSKVARRGPPGGAGRQTKKGERFALLFLLSPQPPAVLVAPKSFSYAEKKIPPLMYNKVGLPTKQNNTSKEDQVVKLDTDSLAHTRWNCKYHIVFAPKYRRQVIYGKIKADIGIMLRKLCEYKEVEILEAEACKDHIHMLVSIPPKYSVSQIMGYLKGKSSLMIFEKYANMKYKYGNRHFWCRGYYVDTVGRNKKVIEEYIRNQLQQDHEEEQLSIKEFVDPFTGQPVKEGK